MSKTAIFLDTIFANPTAFSIKDLKSGAVIHPEQNRVISIRETARAQTFPDKVRFFGTIPSQYRQIGNAVPPILAEEIGKFVKNHMIGDYPTK